MALRKALRRGRLADAIMPGADRKARPVGGKHLAIFGAGLALVEGTGGRMLVCEHCNHCYGAASEDPKKGAARRVVAFERLNAYNRYAYNKGEIELREFLCPSCGTRIATELRRAEDPVLSDLAFDRPDA